MAILVSASGISHSFASRPLFEKITFAIESDDRIGLIGPNGAGKSSLLRILASQIQPDQGTLAFQKGIRISFLEQTPSFSQEATIQSTLMAGLSSHNLPNHDLTEHDWEGAARVDELISKLALGDPQTKIQTLSGGWKRRVALARELVRTPDLLLMDEPTNHLDIEGIVWLEEFIASAPFATFTVTHDRVFLQKIATRILELDKRNPGGLLSVNGDYAAYLETKEQLLQSQERREVILKNTLRRETEWLRQGAKARTTKQQARIQRAEDLGSEVKELGYRNQSRVTRLDFQGAEKNPKKLIEAKGISKSFGSRILFSDLSLILSPGTRIGLIGRNGCGKSTLIRVLTGLEEPTTGSVRHSENLSVAYFSQERETMDPTQTVVKTLCPQGEYVTYRKNRIHIRSYLDRFLFSSGQMEMPVGKLSGGEQSRILLARLMLEEANVLVLDEPTNDLDLVTLTVLQDCLIDFPGAVLLVTHDRYFLDQIATELLVFDGDPQKQKVIPFADLDQWTRWKSAQTQGLTPGRSTQTHTPQVELGKGDSASKKKKLSFKEQRELESMEATIGTAEKKLAQLTEESSTPAVSKNTSRLFEITREMTELQDEIEKLYVRWAELDAVPKA